jgi:hypothetical protein
VLRINDVYDYQQTQFRLLSETPLGYIWINIDNKSALPEFIDRLSLNTLIEEEACTLTIDPYKSLRLSNESSESSLAIKRDDNYALISPIILDPNHYEASVRGPLINNVLAQNKTTKQTLYRLLRNYWQRGQTPNALLPIRTNKRKDGEERQVNKKLGRPRIHTEGEGMIITDKIAQLFNLAINRHLLNQNKHTIGYAYRKFQSIYSSKYPQISETEIPTIWQFKYHYDTNFNSLEKLRSRTNKKVFNKDIRPLHSTVNTHILGPGSKYEIDATIADIYLLSNSDRASIVGRPIIYLVADVFSRMITGFYIGFENPSYVTSAQAIKMAVCDKTDICKKFGIDISLEDWPCIGLPEAILADRGELLGSQIETLEKSFSIRIENTPAYRGDLKGIVERYFNTIQANFKPYTTGMGAVQGKKEVRRGGHDYRIDATLTITDFTKIILNSILMHNNYHLLASYDREADMPADMPLVPIEIWNWGLQNRTGQLRAVDANSIYIALLPRKKATLSNSGIKLFSVNYTCSEIIANGWLHRKGTISRPKDLQVAYDLIDASKIYIFYEHNSLNYWVGTLADRSREFIDCSWWEVWQIQRDQKKTTAKQSLKSELALIELERQNQEIIDAAKILKNASHESKRSQISKIRSNRDIEKASERHQQKKSYQVKNKTHLKVIKDDSSNSSSDEELALDNPIYASLLFEDE